MKTKTKVALTYDEFRQVENKYYEHLLCGHYIPEDKSIKYHLQEINCPICGKTRTMGKTMNVSADTAKKMVSPDNKNVDVVPVDERLTFEKGQRVVIYAPKTVYTDGGMGVRKTNKKEKVHDGKKGTVIKSVWGTFVGSGYEIALDDGSVVVLNYEWVNKLNEQSKPIAEPKEVEEDDIWCHCGEKQTFGSYPQDGECSCGLHKHHVHCGTCGKISQIG